MLSFKEHTKKKCAGCGTTKSFDVNNARNKFCRECQKIDPESLKGKSTGLYKETVDPKFERATKTEYHYTGRINNKSYVVPHSYNYEQKTSDKVTPMHHHVVVSLNHTIHNNPSLTPEEHARVNSHILDIHGGQESAKTVIHEALRKNLRSQSDIDKFASRGRAAKNLLGLPQSLGKLVREAINHGDEVQISDHYGLDRRQRGIVLHPSKVRTNGRGVPTDVPGAYKPVDHKKEHVVKLHNGSHAVVPKRLLTKVLKEEPMIQEGRPIRGDVFRHHIEFIAKKTLHMPDAMVGVMGGPNKEEARAHLKKMGWTDKQIHQHEHELNERTLTPAEDNKKEEMVMSMKKNIQGFKERYGDKAKSVMYATATKHAKELAESEQLDEEGLHAYKVIHKGKEIDKIFYGSHQDPEDVKRSLVHHDGYHPDIKVTKERKTTKKPFKDPGLADQFSGRHDQGKHHANSPIRKEEVEQLDELSKGTLKSYIKKAVPDLKHHAGMSGYYTGKPMYRSSQLRDNTAQAMKSHDRKEKTRSAGISSAASKLEESSGTLKTVKSVLNEAFTRRHFKQIAELIKGHTDAKTRQRLADTHAAAFEKDNPRFDHARFHAAAGTVHKKD